MSPAGDSDIRVRNDEGSNHYFMKGGQFKEYLLMTSLNIQKAKL